MAPDEKKNCSICGSEFDGAAEPTILKEAGEWLSAELWRDSGELCPQCLENRANLAMMYVVDR